MVLKARCVQDLHFYMNIFIGELYIRQEGFSSKEVAKGILGESISGYLQGEERE